MCLCVCVCVCTSSCDQKVESARKFTLITYINTLAKELLTGLCVFVSMYDYVASPESLAGTHFGQPYSQAHRSDRVCLGSCGSQSKPSDMDSGKLVFMSHVLRLAILESQGAVP